MGKNFRLIFLFCLLVVSSVTKANRPFPNFRPLSDHSKISLLTCDPGNQLYTTFGHSAIRISDPAQGMDIVFNYGTFNFNVPNFYLKFASGKLLYRLSYESYRQFMAMYVYESRTVIEQELSLNKEQRELFLAAIRENYKVENRYYKYDFFFDNCATRIVYMFNQSFPDSLVYQSNLEIGESTFRELLDEYLMESDWSNVGINLLLGSVTDVVASPKEQSFSPDYLLLYIKNLDFNGKPFVIKEDALLEGTFTMPKTPFLLSPGFWFWALFFVVAIFSILYRHKSWVIFDKSFFFFFGIIGLVVFMATFATDHDAMRDNMNLLWINPVYFLLALLIGSRHWKVTLGVSLMLLFSNLFVLAGWNALPQTFHSSFIPLILLASLRLSILSLKYREK